MGAWGTGIMEDDLGQDILGDFEERVSGRATPARAAAAILRANQELLADPDDGPVVYLVLATLLLEHGVARHPVLERAAEVIRQEAGLERWREAGPEELAARREGYRALGERIQAALAASPSAGPKRVRLPKEGDLLQIPLPDGRYAYAHYVYFDPHEGPLLQVFDRISPVPLGAEELAGAGPLFPPIIVGINPPVRSGRWRVIGRKPVVGFRPPLFKAGTKDSTGKVYLWWLRKSGEDIRLGPDLPAAYQALEHRLVWPAEWVEERIATGTHPYLERIH